MSEKKTAGQSIASLVLGILSLLCFGIFTAIPAVICGHIAKARIKADSENLQGEGMALAGLITGYITIGFTVVAIAAGVAIPFLSGNMNRTAAIEGQAGCSTILVCEQMYRAENGTYVGVESIDQLPGLEVEDLQGRFFDYSGYAVEVAGDHALTITAIANGTDGIYGDVVLKVSDEGAAEWSGSLLE